MHEFFATTRFAKSPLNLEVGLNRKEMTSPQYITPARAYALSEVQDAKPGLNITNIYHMLHALFLSTTYRNRHILGVASLYFDQRMCRVIKLLCLPHFPLLMVCVWMQYACSFQQ